MLGNRTMQLPLQITFDDLDRSEAIEAAIRERAEKLDQFFDRIMSCRVAVGLEQKHKRQGKLYSIRIDLTVPRSEIVVNRDRAEDIYVAIRDAFDHARRKLEDYADRLRGEVKAHEMESRGRVAQLFPDQGYGFIEKADGSRYYFHSEALAGVDTGQMKVGDEVVFLEEPGGETPQAHRVQARKRGE